MHGAGGGTDGAGSRDGEPDAKRRREERRWRNNGEKQSDREELEARGTSREARTRAREQRNRPGEGATRGVEEESPVTLKRDRVPRGRKRSGNVASMRNPIGMSFPSRGRFPFHRLADFIAYSEFSFLSSRLTPDSPNGPGPETKEDNKRASWTSLREPLFLSSKTFAEKIRVLFSSWRYIGYGNARACSSRVPRRASTSIARSRSLQSVSQRDSPQRRFFFSGSARGD